MEVKPQNPVSHKLERPPDAKPLRRQEAYSSPKINRARVMRPDDLEIAQRPEDRFNWSHAMDDRLVKPRGIAPIKSLPPDSLKLSSEAAPRSRVDTRV